MAAGVDGRRRRGRSPTDALDLGVAAETGVRRVRPSHLDDNSNRISVALRAAELARP